MRSISIVGAGRIGKLITRLLQSTGEYRILLIDQDAGALAELESLSGVSALRLKVDAHEMLRRPIAQSDAVISACGYRSNPAIARAASEAGISYFDLTEDIATTREIRAIAENAAEGQIFLSQCGLAPGFIGILGNHAESITLNWQADTGGRSRSPQPPASAPWWTSVSKSVFRNGVREAGTGRF